MSPLVLVTELSVQGALGAPQPSFQIDSQCNYSKADSFVSLLFNTVSSVSSKVPVNSLLNTVGNSPTFYNHYLLKYKCQDGKYLSIFFTADSSDLEECLIQSGHSTNICKMNVLLYLSTAQWKTVSNIQPGSKMVIEYSRCKKRNWQ